MKTIGIIGGGNMGAAILRRLKGKYKIAVSEKDPQRAKELAKKYRVKNCDLTSLVKNFQILILAIKPQDFKMVLEEMAPHLTPKQLVISIAAGIPTSFIEKALKGQVRVIRTMPNMPAQIGQGITAISRGRYATVKDLSVARKIFDCVGATVVVEESQLNAVTAVSGSGPAYLFLFAEHLISTARKLGLSEEHSRKLVEKTLQGSIELLLQSKEDAASLRAKVTSKGGTTQAALETFEKNHLGDIYQQGLEAAKKRAEELAQTWQ
ncbi:MAG: pyrroline-5-carboxylate reductase [Candidatus Omnitrophica bacterium]|nr:pyrroline-5-carboxylate reductase [Candidatus Omnitrophota bacterium]